MVQWWINPLTHAPSDEDWFVRWFDFSEDDIRRSEHTSAGYDGYRSIKNVVWFIPDFDNPYYGGICTILRFANYLRTEKGVSSCYSVTFDVNSDVLLRKIRVIDPGCSSSEVVLSSGDDFSAVPDADACLATLWTTAYTALKFNRARRKFYFIQDYEPLFYRAGTASGLAESTYRFGFYGIANTVSLRDIYERETRRPATHFSPCVDSGVFFPPDPVLQRSKAGRSYRQVFCYTRPNHPRNAFELVAAALRIVKRRMGDRVRIVGAGDEWPPGEYDLDGVVENLGRLDYRSTGDLYRQSDAGVALMFTCHPSYIPFELMACGALVIANRNLWTGWFLKNGENCLVAEASATCLAEVIIQGLENDDERARITARARELIEAKYSDWGAEFSRVYEFMCDPERTAAAEDRSAEPL